MSKVFEIKRPAIILLGAPGAGKGTQGKILGTIPRFFHCECGNVFRSLDTRTPLGQKFVEYSSRGELVPDELTVELWKTQVANWSDMHLYKPDIDYLVLDGIPRNVAQAQHGEFCASRASLSPVLPEPSRAGAAHAQAGAEG